MTKETRQPEGNLLSLEDQRLYLQSLQQEYRGDGTLKIVFSDPQDNFSLIFSYTQLLRLIDHLITEHPGCDLYIFHTKQDSYKVHLVHELNGNLTYKGNQVLLNFKQQNKN